MRGDGIARAVIFGAAFYLCIMGTFFVFAVAKSGVDANDDRARVELLRVRHDQALSAILASPPSPARKELESVLFELDREHNAILARRPALKYYPLHKGTMSK